MNPTRIYVLLFENHFTTVTTVLDDVLVRFYVFLLNFLLFTFKGSSFGTAVTYVMCGYLIAMFGWESVYYVTGGMGFVWYVAWMLLVYDTPAEHPTISVKERAYIENCITKTSQSKAKPVSKNNELIKCITQRL